MTNTAATDLTPFTLDVLDFLTEEGFRPSTDDDGDVVFKFEGGTYVVLTAQGDPTYLSVVYPYFWDIEDDDERRRVHEAVAHAHRTVRLGRLTVLDDDVNASVSAYLPDGQAYRSVFLRSLGALKAAVNAFRDHMHASSSN